MENNKVLEDREVIVQLVMELAKAQGLITALASTAGLKGDAAKYVEDFLAQLEAIGESTLEYVSLKVD